MILRAEISPLVQKRQRGAYIKPKGRPGRVVMYDPDVSREYKKTLGMLLKQQMKGAAPFDCPLDVIVEFVLPIPQSWTEKKKAAALAKKVLPLARKKGDVDNLVKAAFDAANGIVWLDDSQVVIMSAWKIYGETPAVNMSVSPYRREKAFPEGADTFDC